MSISRQKALQDVLERTPRIRERPANKISQYYGENVFSLHTMREYLTDEACDGILNAMENHTPISRSIADQVASAMKEWAMSRGATHYTHWFQPLTGATAEKHDSFITPTGDGRAIEKFDGSLLVQQEPDASSFPSGGIRNTFEARGYTLWDPTSQAFVWDNTLCIPTIFISYTGFALDNKMPLLKALARVDTAATDVCQYFDKNVTKVVATLGWEQEYFLVDKALHAARPDLQLTGRLLFAATPAKGQQLDDHYFGSIPARATAFMKEFELESHKLGIPVTTRHNEVAPNQFECAPVYEEANLANDHNLLLMEVMEQVARKHNFRVLLHEKPYPGLNGSGKHNNWSLGTNTNVNLLKPGNTPKTNLRFLTFFVNTLAALHKHADVVRAAIAAIGNDHRLGANEAPPAIISAFIGSQLSDLLDDLERSIKAGKLTPEDKTALKLEIGRIPEVLLDNTDRNRTSPFAFTGNKFELRAVGSTANCAVAMIVLNTIVSEQLEAFKKDVDHRIDQGDKKDDAILKELQRLITRSKAIRFEGNGYSDEWVVEAKKRGLSNLKNTPEALEVFSRKEVIKLFENQQVLAKEELSARVEVELENYILKSQIEYRVLLEMARGTILPTVVKYQNQLLTNVQGLKDVFGKDGDALSTAQMELLKTAGQWMQKLHVDANKLEALHDKAESAKTASAKAKQYAEKVVPGMNELADCCSALESLVDDALWPFPKLAELLFTK
ncbi:MAG: glutamine synthetase III [Flavobacteriales bacterium]|nr:glutamine synthetase III [Flavobacteriales bacterium]